MWQRPCGPGEEPPAACRLPPAGEQWLSGWKQQRWPFYGAPENSLTAFINTTRSAKQTSFFYFSLVV